MSGFVAEVNSRTGGAFEKVPPGTHPAVCVAIIDMGNQWSEYQGKGDWARELFFVWELPGVRQSGTKDRNHVIGSNFKFSLNKKARMYQMIKGRMGRDLPDGTQYEVGQELGKPCLLSVVENGNYTNYGGVMALPTGYTVPAPQNPLTAITLDEFRSGAKVVPGWVPYDYGDPVADKIKRCREIAGDQGKIPSKKADQNAQNGSGSTNGAPGEPVPASAGGYIPSQQEVPF